MIIHPLKSEPTYYALTRFQTPNIPTLVKIGYSMAAFPALLGARIDVIQTPSGNAFKQQQKILTLQNIYFCFLNICWSSVIAKALSYSKLSVNMLGSVSIILPWIIGITILHFSKSQSEMYKELHQFYQDYFLVIQGYKLKENLDEQISQSAAFTFFAIQHEDDEEIKTYALNQSQSCHTLFHCLFLLKHTSDPAILSKITTFNRSIDSSSWWDISFFFYFIVQNTNRITNKNELIDYLTQLSNTHLLQLTMGYLN